MGFWESLGSSIGKGINKASEDFEKAAAKAESMSDEQLIRAFKNSSNMTAAIVE